MPTYTLIDLYEEYTESRKINLTFDQFTSLTLFYPTLLVLYTDGQVDEQEWKYIKHLANNLADSLVPPVTDPDLIYDLKKSYFNELKYLLQHLDVWERKFIKTLKNYLKEQPHKKASVLKFIYLFAAASEGICEKEEVMIEYLKKELALQEVA
jgi:hypothetical protein